MDLNIDINRKKFLNNGYFIIKNFFNKEEISIINNEIIKSKKTEIYKDSNNKIRRIEKFYNKGKFLKEINDRFIDLIWNILNLKVLIFKDKLDLNEDKNILAFNCKKKTNVAAEILYVAANVLSSQSMYSLSNFYLNLAKYLNEDFHSYDTLMAENFYKISNFKKAKKIYNNLSKKGKAFHWYSSKQLAKIFIESENKNEALKLIEKSYNNLVKKNIYETFDYAEFLKNNEKFKEAITFYTQVIKQIQKKHPLYAESTDGRGIAYERIGEWDKAEKDLLASLEVKPDQAYVINYLAYSWIEKGIKIEKSLKMLEKANKLKSNDPYITDSLGWALFKLERYEEAKEYLQLAVRLLPADPIVNDHYGDVLWKIGNEIQARYYWDYVLNLEKIEDKLKKNVEDKLIKGL